MKHIELYESENWQKLNRLNEDERQDILERGVFTLDDIEKVANYAFTEDEINQLINSSLDGYDSLEEIIGMVNSGSHSNIPAENMAQMKNAISQREEVIEALKSFIIKWIKIR
jgi:uncharacterized protein (UPF0297 family)